MAIKGNQVRSHLVAERASREDDGKMDAWLLARPGRKKTRMFVIGWLNKVEPALAPAKVEEVEQW